MSKRKIILISILCILLFTGVKVWNNGALRTTLRAILNHKYPVEIQKIKNNIVNFDLSKKAPARLAVGIRYPINYNLSEIENYKINGSLEVKLYRAGKIIKSESINRIDRTYLDFDDTGYKVSVFYTFAWSPDIITNQGAKLEINLNNKFENLDLILFDYGIK